jgi:hypothetical protein
MSNLKITDLSATITPALTDVMEIVVDPGGTPTSKKVTVGDLLISNHSVLQNLLTNSQWMAMSGSTVCERISGAAPVLDGANAALVNNLVTNGGFDSVTTGWTAISSAALSSDAGTGKTGNCLKITENGEANPGAYQTVTTVIGKLYQFTGYVKSGTEATCHVRIGSSGAASSEYYIIGPEAAADWTSTVTSIIFEATTTSTTVSLLQIAGAASGTNILFDSITLYEVTPGYVAADSLGPDGWYRESANGGVYREHDGTNTKDGSFYALKMVAPAAMDLAWYPFGFANRTSAISLQRYCARPLTIGVWAKTSTANAVRIAIWDDGANYSSYHSGGGGWEWLEVSHTVSASSTDVTPFQFNIAQACAVYFSQPMLVFGSSIGEGNYQPIPNEVIWFQTYMNLTGYNGSGTLASGTTVLNLEALSNGRLGKGVKAIKLGIEAKNTAVAAYLRMIGLGGSGSIESQVWSQVANVTVNAAPTMCSCDSSGDISAVTVDANWSNIAFGISAIQIH